MTNLALGLWSFPLLLLLIFIRIPIGLAMLVVGIGGNYIVNGSWIPVLGQFKHLTYGTFSSYSLSIIPLFLLMGQFATLGGLSASLFKASQAWLGHRKGGVAMSAIGACAGFGSICGSSLATAATMGQVALPELRSYGYSNRLATGALAAGGTLGILIPPSVILVIYAILTEQNIAKLFMAAFIPGILAAITYMLTIYVYVSMTNESGGVSERVPYAQRFRVLLSTWPVFAIFITVVGGIYMGIFTPTEAAAIGAASTAIVAIVNRSLSWRALLDAIYSTASSTGMIFLIILGAGVYNAFLASTQLPQMSSEYVVSLGYSPWVILGVVLLMYLAFGCIMDSLSMILLTVPIFFPIMSALDFGMPAEDFALWFGILVLIVVEVGLITPPVGMNLFVINSMAKDVPIAETFKGVLPFVLADIIRVLILVAFPSLTLGLVWVFY